MIDHEKEGKRQGGISRRQFLKFCGVVAGALGLDATFGPKIFEAFAAGPKPSVLWLHFADVLAAPRRCCGPSTRGSTS